MTANELRKILSKLAKENKLEYYIKREDGNIMSIRFLVEKEDVTDSWATRPNGFSHFATRISQATRRG